MMSPHGITLHTLMIISRRTRFDRWFEELKCDTRYSDSCFLQASVVDSLSFLRSVQLQQSFSPIRWRSASTNAKKLDCEFDNQVFLWQGRTLLFLSIFFDAGEDKLNLFDLYSFLSQWGKFLPMSNLTARINQNDYRYDLVRSHCRFESRYFSIILVSGYIVVVAFLLPTNAGRESRMHRRKLGNFVTITRIYRNATGFSQYFTAP